MPNRAPSTNQNPNAGGHPGQNQGPSAGGHPGQR
jgi:hypothetical protein